MPSLAPLGRSPLWLLALAAAAVALVLHLPGLGSADWTGDDEALDAGFVRSVAQEGRWLFPEFNGEYLPPKPPLFYWSAALAVRFHRRFDEWSVRLPSALAAAALVAATVVFGASFVGREASLLAGLALAVMPVVGSQARVGRADMLMALLVSCALFLYMAPPEPPSRRTRWIFFALLGLAVLAKGAAGLGLVVFVVAADAVFAGRRIALRSLVHPSLLALVVLGASWYVAASLHWGGSFVTDNVLGENLRHFFGAAAGGGPAPLQGPFGGSGKRGLLHHASHLANVLLAALPWSLLLPVVLLRGDEEPETRLARRSLACWLVAGLAFFTIATRKSPYYLLPLMPPLALLVASWARPRIANALAAGEISAPSVRLAIAAAAAVFAGCLGVWLFAAAGSDFEAVIAAVATRPLRGWAALVIAAAFGAAATRALAERRVAAALVLAWPAACGVFSVAHVVEPALAARSSLRGFGRELAERVPAGGAVFFWRMPLPAVVLYSGRERIATLRDPSAAPRGEFFLVVPDGLRDELPPEWRERGRTLVEVEARVFTRKRSRLALVTIPGAPATQEVWF